MSFYILKLEFSVTAWKGFLGEGDAEGSLAGFPHVLIFLNAIVENIPWTLKLLFCVHSNGFQEFFPQSTK